MSYMTCAPSFNGEEHKKAWLLKVAANKSKDICRFRIRNRYADIDELREYCGNDTPEYGIMESVMSLYEKYRKVLYLFYAEGYKTAEIANILSCSETAVRKRLQYGRQKLKIEYGGQ